ncbi:hypothetical protein YC2023_033296 [Brassica napus]
MLVMIRFEINLFCFLFLKLDLIFMNLFRRQRHQHSLLSVEFKRVFVGEAIMIHTSIILPGSSKEYMTGFHWQHITQDFIFISTNGYRNQYLSRNFHLALLIEPLQSVGSWVFLNFQTQFLHHSLTSYIDTTSSINNETAHLSLNHTPCVE